MAYNVNSPNAEGKMQAYRLETKITQNSILVLKSLPFREGEVVEVIILVKTSPPARNRYPLRGLPVTYIDPTEPIAQSDWEIMR